MRDCGHHFVSERDFGRDVQRVSLPSRKVPDESFGRDETIELHKTSHEQCIPSQKNQRLFIINKQFAFNLHCDVMYWR